MPPGPPGGHILIKNDPTDPKIKKSCFYRIFSYIIWGRRHGRSPLLYAAPPKGERSVEDPEHMSFSHHPLRVFRYLFLIRISLPHGPRPCRRPSPKWITFSSKNHQKSRPQKNCFFSQNGALLAPRGYPKITKISKSFSQGHTFYPFRKTSRKSSISGPSRTLSTELAPS